MTTISQSRESNSPNRRIAIAIAVAGCVFVLTLSQLYLTVAVIPRFSSIFHDLFEGQPLPAVTVLALNCRWLLLGLSGVWAISVAFVVRRKASMRYLYAILALQVAQIGFTMLALFIPLQKIIETIETAKPH